MGLDQLLELTSSVASKALPICGVVVLIFLAVFVKHSDCTAEKCE